jgi:Zn-dependent protease/CBS domain-containing protein
MAQPLPFARPRFGFRLAGIEIVAHWTFPLLLVWVFLSQAASPANVGHALVTTGLVVAVFACVLVHELGHAFVARHFGIRTRSITLYPIGGVARLTRIPTRPREELAIAIAGPLTSIGLAALSAGAVVLTVGVPAEATLWVGGQMFLAQLAVANLLIGLFNLLPAFPMDGGRVLRAFLAMRFEYARATRYAARVGKGCALVLAFVGAFHDWMLLLIAVFVFVGAEQEAAFVELRAAIRRVPVRAAMLTRVSTLASSATLASVAEELVKSGQRDFPVLDANGNIAGVLSHDDVVAALAEGGRSASVGEVMRKNPLVLNANQTLESALDQLQDSDPSVALVTDCGQLVGMLTRESVGEWALLHPDDVAEGRSFSPLVPRTHTS